MPGEHVLVIDDSATILKVVQMVLTKAGYRVRTAADGEQGVAAAREERPDLILLDFVMPRMNGYQVCKELHESPELRDVPVVLMSAKGDQVGEHFVRVMGIVDYITKPFSPEAITAVVGHTLAKYRPAGVSEMSSLDEPTGPLPLAPPPLPPPRQRTPLDRKRAFFEELRGAIARSLANPDLPEPQLREMVRARLSDALLARLLDPMMPDEPQAVLRGDLTAVPVAEVLKLLGEQGQTGVLHIRRDPAEVLVAFRGGRIDFAGGAGLGDEFRIGQCLLELGVIPRDDLERFLAARQSGGPLPLRAGTTPPETPGRWLGEQLVKHHLIAPADLVEALKRQTAEHVYEALRWRAGAFSFIATRELGPLADSAALQLSVEGLLMEGFRRVDEWHLIERAVDDFDAVFLRNESAVAELPRARLTREELAVLELVNGKNTVKDIQRQSRLGSFEVSKMLFRLMSIRLIRRRVAPVAV